MYSDDLKTESLKLYDSLKGNKKRVSLNSVYDQLPDHLKKEADDTGRSFARIMNYLVKDRNLRRAKSGKLGSKPTDATRGYINIDANKILSLSVPDSHSLVERLVGTGHIINII